MNDVLPTAVSIGTGVDVCIALGIDPNSEQCSGLIDVLGTATVGVAISPTGVDVGLGLCIELGILTDSPACSSLIAAESTTTGKEKPSI